MNSFSRFLLDLVYPPKCALCGEVGEPSICQCCLQSFIPIAGSRSGLVGIDRADYVFDYGGAPGNAVKKLKYDRVTSLVDPMAQMILEAFLRQKLDEVDFVVPVPIHWSRRCQRGFNQSEMLCTNLPANLVQPMLLKRVRPTKPQVGLSSEERSRNLRGAFKVNMQVEGKSILLVDDVLTTGHTAMECAKALRGVGAKSVSGLFFAGESIL